eukprot:scaffold1.g5258.t1
MLLAALARHLWRRLSRRFASETSPTQRLLLAIIRGDLAATERLLKRFGAQSADVAASVKPSAGGGFLSPVTPLGAAVATAPSEEAALALVWLLAAHGGAAGAACCARWHDSSGRHSPLSKALQRRHYRVAAALLQLGSPAGVLCGTELLAATAFSEEPIAWLLDAVAACPEHRAEVCHIAAVAYVVREAMLEAVKTSCASRLPHAARAAEVARLVAVAERIVGMLLASGTPPAAAHHIHLPPCFSGDPGWRRLAALATAPLEWSPATHELFPLRFRAAARELLLLGHFHVAAFDPLVTSVIIGQLARCCAAA